MRWKLDENLAPAVAKCLAAPAHDVASVVGEHLSGCTDETLYRRCVAERRVLVTLDLDFANPIRFPPDIGPGIVILRVGRPTLRALQTMVERVLPAATAPQLSGNLWIVEPDRLRVYNPRET